MELIYDRSGCRTYNIAFTILEDEAAAEDVVLDAHLKLWRRPDLALIHHDSLGSYLDDLVARDARLVIANDAEFDRQRRPGLVR